MAAKIRRNAPEVKAVVAMVRRVLTERRPEIDRQPDLRLLEPILVSEVLHVLRYGAFHQEHTGRSPSDSAFISLVMSSIQKPVCDLGNDLVDEVDRLDCTGNRHVPDELREEKDAADRLYHAVRSVLADVREGRLADAPAGVEAEAEDTPSGPRP